jgi:hypothetical protein
MRLSLKSILVGAMLTAVPALVPTGHAQSVTNTWQATSGQEIPDNSPDSGLLSSININVGDPQLNGVADPVVAQLLDIQLDISGGWNGDYIATLYHILPDNSVQSVVLLDRIGQDGSNPYGFENAGFDGVILEAGQPDIHLFGGSYTDASPLTGTYSPDGDADFDAFLNTTALGTWSLYITDNSSGSVGTLSDWSLTLVTTPEPEPVYLLGAGLLAGLGWRFRRRSP